MSGAQAIGTWLDPLLPGGANAGMMPDTANAAASLTTLRTAYSLTRCEGPRRNAGPMLISLVTRGPARGHCRESPGVLTGT